jgi:hypothetical protein
MVSVAFLFALLADRTPAADPPGTQQVLDNLKKWFKDHANSDGVMTKTEAAKAFGYPKPYDANAKKDAKKDDKEEKTDSKSAKTDDKDKDRLYGNRPDYLFMKNLDKNKDDQVDQKEFDTWAHEFAVKVANAEKQPGKKTNNGRGLSALEHMAGAFGRR